MGFMISRISKVNDYKCCNCNLAIMKEHRGAKLTQAEATQGITIILLPLVTVGTGEPGALFFCSPGKTLPRSIKLIFQNVVFLDIRVKGFSQWVEI